MARLEAIEILSEYTAIPSLEEQADLLHMIEEHLTKVALAHGYDDWRDFYFFNVSVDDRELRNLIFRLYEEP